jgi:hypothetical protein
MKEYVHLGLLNNGRTGPYLWLTLGGIKLLNLI